MTTPVERLRAELGRGEPVFTSWCGLPEPAVAGMLAREPGYGCVTLDLQHGTTDLASVIRAIPLVTAAGRPCLVRVPVGEFATASRALDVGAAGVIAPMVNTVADAESFAASTKYPPVGGRSWGPVQAAALNGLALPDYFARANDFTLSFAMIETREALGAIDGILAVPGIDAIFIGPSDLSIALSGGAALAPDGAETSAAIDHALARAKAAGRLAGIYAGSGERAGDYARRGYDLVAIGSDGLFLRAGAALMRQAAG